MCDQSKPAAEQGSKEVPSAAAALAKSAEITPAKSVSEIRPVSPKIKESGAQAEIIEIEPNPPPAPSKNKALSTEDLAFLDLLSGETLQPKPTVGLSGLTQKGPRCTTCSLIKPFHQTWEDHNCSEDHVKCLIQTKGFCRTIRELESNYGQYLEIRCDLCDTAFSSALLFCVHKRTDEHTRRHKELLDLVRLATKANKIERWVRITKPQKTDPKNISRVIRGYKSKAN